MAIFSKAVAVAAIFATLTSAAPLKDKRAVVYQTVTDIAWTTVDTTITLFPGEPTPSPIANAVTVPAVPTSPALDIAAAPPASSSSSSTSSSSTSEAPQVTQPPAPAPPAAAAPAASPPAPAPPAVAPAPPASSTTSSPPPASTSSSSSSGGSGPSGTGDGTYYDTATTMTNPSYCDTANDGTTENVVALSASIMNQGLCGKSITVSYGGKSATGKVVDSCPGCNSQSIDMSRAMFGDLSSLDAGRITVSWQVV